MLAAMSKPKMVQVNVRLPVQLERALRKQAREFSQAEGRHIGVGETAARLLAAGIEAEREESLLLQLPEAEREALAGLGLRLREAGGAGGQYIFNCLRLAEGGDERQALIVMGAMHVVGAAPLLLAGKLRFAEGAAADEAGADYVASIEAQLAQARIPPAH